jgi:2-dehydro-3-deoxyphosphogluconate aldolase/(4S)-4-hydroxy-2-oxoglutarate aldolase
MKYLHEQLKSFGVIPVLIIENKNFAEELGSALIEGGLPCAEVTFRTDAARNSIERLSKLQPSLLVGAGTVLTTDQVKIAVDAGARFVVSPGLNRRVVEYCINNSIPVIPGVLTPTEVETAIEYGLDVVKLFPAEASGGITYLKAISAPYRNIKFIPTGGIDDKNLLPYLRQPNVIACGGSWMAGKDLIAEKNFQEIKRLTTQTVSTVLGFELKHIGVNMPDAEIAKTLTLRISELLKMPVKDGSTSMFVGGQFEILKRNYLGKHEHIALGTNFIDRAVAYFDRSGIKVLPETLNEKDGKLSTVYLDIDIGGFALHLVQL